MTERERLLLVLQGKTPDRVPWFADLGHWYRAESGQIWNLFTVNNCSPEMAALHREVKAGWYVEVGSLHAEQYTGGVIHERLLQGEQVIENYRTPLGSLQMIRRWNPVSYSWDIVKRLVESPDDLVILTCAMENRIYVSRYENWEKIEAIGQDIGLGFPSLGYTGLGSLISYYMGVENTIYAIADETELVGRYIETYNRRHLELVRLYAQSPAPHLIFTDNLSGDVQPPDLFRRYSLAHYTELAGCLHTAGKTVSAHIDGRMHGLIGLLAEAGIDIADACTPQPSGDLDPQGIRREAGDRMVIMGGISPVMWLPETPEKEFIAHVRAWLDLRRISSRLVQSAGDQVPPGTRLQRIKLVYDLVEEYGRY